MKVNRSPFRDMNAAFILPTLPMVEIRATQPLTSRPQPEGVFKSTLGHATQFGAGRLLGSGQSSFFIDLDRDRVLVRHVLA